MTVAIGANEPATMIAMSDIDQSAVVGTAVAEPPSVKLLDAYDNPVPGVSVAFRSSSALGPPLPGSPVTTDANGVATLESWTLGTVSGEYRAVARAGTLNAIFTAQAGPGPPATMTLGPVEFSGLPGVTVPFSGGQTKRYAAFIKDAYGNGIGFQSVDFSSADEAVAFISRQTGPQIIEITARYLPTDRTVEFRASLTASPGIFGVATVTVLATEPPPNPKPDRFDIPYNCGAIGCTLVSVVNGNVLSDNGFGADELGNLPATITRFGGPSMAGFSGGPLNSVDGWFPVGTTATATLLSGSYSVTLAADGTLNFSRVIGFTGEVGFGFSFQYEVQNASGTSATTVLIVRSADGALVTTSRSTIRSNGRRLRNLYQR